MNVIKALALPCSSSAEQVKCVMPSEAPANGDRPVPVWVPPKKKAFNPKGGVMIGQELQCPLADVNVKPSKIKVCPFHAHKQRGEFFHVHGEIALDTVPGKKRCDDETVANEDTARLLKNIGGGDRIREICTRFYARAFIDYQLGPFFFNFDGATNHALRLADWIIEHMGGEGTPWFDSGRWTSREPVHQESWYSKTRSPEKIGQPFKLDDCRVWVRLHFWAVHECGLGHHKAFMSWYARFLAYFVQIYEEKTKEYVAIDAYWALQPGNIEQYVKDGNKMLDVIGIQ